MDRIMSAKVFTAIVEHGSMAGAANVLDMSRSMVTRYLKEMEQWADARLLHRSTRRLSLTPAGEQVLAQCHQLLKIAEALERVGDSNLKEPQGLLRVSASQFLAEEVLAELSHRFIQRYPKISLDIHVSNQAANLVEERLDLAIRISHNLEPNLIARSLGQCHSTLCATPQYLARAGKLETLDDLTHHNCLAYSYFGNSLWQFHHQGEPKMVPISGSFSANESNVLRRATLNHSGISMLPRHCVAKLIQQGQLVEVLAQYVCLPMGIHGVYRSREHMPPALRAFIDFLVTEFKTIDL